MMCFVRNVVINHKLKSYSSWLCSAMVERLTPDQKVACSNHVRVNSFFPLECFLTYKSPITYNPYVIARYIMLGYLMFCLLFLMCRAEMENPEVSLRFGLILEAYCRGCITHMDNLQKQVKCYN